MKALIPAKKNSTRVQSKNWRPFYEGKNLVEIKIEQLLKCLDRQDIFLSTDFAEAESIATNYGIQFILRNESFASDATPWPDALKGIVEEIPVGMQEDILWVEVINPLFSRYDEMILQWKTSKTTHDSMVLVAPFSKFLLNERGQPLNFMFGKWHAMSQNLEASYAWDSACIMKKSDLIYFSYPIGKKPYLFKTGEQCIDIDTPDDFELAQLLYQKKTDGTFSAGKK